MRSLRSVTLVPIGICSRTLKLAIDLRARVTTGFWPAIIARSSAATDGFLESPVASPTPMLMTILSRRGTCISFSYLNCSSRALRICSLYCFFKRGSYCALAIDDFSRALRDAHFLAVLLDLEADAGRLSILRIGQRDIRQVNRRFLGDDRALLGLCLLLVTVDHVHAANDGLVVLGHHANHFTGPALVLAGEHDDLVAFTDFLHFSGSLQHFRRERDDLHVVLGA